MTSVKEQMLEYITEGVALLDKEEPEWYSHVDLDRLDMAQGLFTRGANPSEPSGCGCVIAQIDAKGKDMGRYSTGFFNLKTADMSFELGFCLPPYLYMECDDGPSTEIEISANLQASQYKLLTELWKTVIINLRSTQPAVPSESVGTLPLWGAPSTSVYTSFIY